MHINVADIAEIDKDCFLSEMIQLATDDAVLLHMHQGLESPCNDIEIDGTESLQAPQSMVNKNMMMEAVDDHQQELEGGEPTNE